MGGTTELDNPVRRERGTDISNGLPGQGSPAELPGGGMPGMSSDKEGDADALPAPACPRQCAHSGGGKHPHQWCTRRNMLVSRRVPNGRHPDTVQCAKGADRKRRRLAEAERRESSERAFEAYMEQLENVTTSRYLGRVLTAGDDDCFAMVGNLGKARKSWGRLSCILSWEGADPKVLGKFIKQWRRRCCCLGRRRGYSPRGLSGPWIASRTDSRDGSTRGNHIDGDIGAGSIRLWRRQWGKWASRVT